MIILISLIAIWVLLLWLMIADEYRYYAAVKMLEPEIWRQLGAPHWLKVPVVFVSPDGAKLLKAIAHPNVQDLAKRHYRSGSVFFGYTMCVLAGATTYFTFAV